METKSLLYGLIGFFLGGLLVSVAATTFDKPSSNTSEMSQMTESLTDKQGDDFDKAFIANMIAHHQSAVDMAKLSQDRAKHQEIKDLSLDIITAQQTEIDEMERWQQQWGYSETTPSANHSGH